jgi:hypothetical protein
MIGKLATGMARRGILKGALGLGAAAGIGGNVSHGTGLLGPLTLPASALPPATPLPDRPDWLRAMQREVDEAQEREMVRPRVDSLDLDLAALRGPSPAWKLTQQKARDKVRREASKTLWQRIDDATTRWRRSIGQ